jgi:hypothetical protein
MPAEVLWDLWQDRILRDVGEALVRLDQTDSRAASAIRALRSENEELRLRLAALLRLLMEKNLIDPASFAAAVQTTRELVQRAKS